MNFRSVKLSEVIEKPISGEWGEDGDDIFVLRSTNFTNNGSLDLSNVIKRNIASSKVERKKLLVGDTIIEKSGGSPAQPVGRVVYFDIESEKPYLCNNFTSILRPKNTVNPRYLFWFLFYNHISKQTLRYQNKTTGIINLQTERYLSELEIPLPSHTIQCKIADILDLADKLRKKDLQLIIKYDEFLHGVFYEMFGDPHENEKKWNLDYIRNISTKITDGEHGTVKREDEGRFYLMARNVRDNEVDLSDVSFISEEAHNKIFKRCNPEFEDLLLVCVGATTGRVSLVPKMEDFSLARSVALIKPNRALINPNYLYCIFKTSFVQRQIASAGNASAQAGLYTGKIKEIKIPVPPVDFQNKFSLIAKNIQQQKHSAISQSKNSENLFHNLLKLSFTEKLLKV